MVLKKGLWHEFTMRMTLGKVPDEHDKQLEKLGIATSNNESNEISIYSPLVINLFDVKAYFGLPDRRDPNVLDKEHIYVDTYQGETYILKIKLKEFKELHFKALEQL